jgi:hypothetical protein
VGDSYCYKVSPFQAHWGRWCYTCLLWPASLFTDHVGSVPSLLSSGAFLTQPLLKAFPLLVAGRVLPLLPSLAGLFIYSSVRDLPFPPLWHSGHPALFATCLFLLLLFIIQFGFFLFFFLGGGPSVQGATLIWPRVVCGSTMCHLAHLVFCFSQAGRSLYLLLVSTFNMEWGCYVQTGGVEESEFCLFALFHFALSCKVFLQHLSKILL